MTVNETCFCIGPPGNCPCERRRRLRERIERAAEEYDFEQLPREEQQWNVEAQSTFWDQG